MFLRGASSDLSDEELVRLYQETQLQEHLSTLYLRYTGLVYGVCLKYLKDRDEAKDAVMQIFEKLVTSLLKHEVASFRSWLYVNAKNYCLMSIRSQKGHRTEELSPFLVETGADPHPGDGELEEDLIRLEKCIENLVDDQQVCVRLFYLERRSYKEIVTETGFDLNRVKSYIQNGKRNLKICMESNGG